LHLKVALILSFRFSTDVSPSQRWHLNCVATR
jgi:hypothetical protein